MVTIPAQCTKCGRMWQPPNVVRVGEGSTGTMLDNIRMPCPWPGCDGIARFLSGTFNVTPDNKIEMLTGPAWSSALVDALRLGVRDVLDNAESDPDPLTSVEAKIPDLGPMIADAVRAGLAVQGKPPSQRRRKQLVILVLSALWTVLNTDVGNLQANVDHVRIAIENVLQYVSEHGSVPPL